MYLVAIPEKMIPEHILCKYERMFSSYMYLTKARSSRTEVFCKKGVLRNFAKFMEKHLCQRLSHKCFPVNLLRTPFLTEHIWWLLLQSRRNLVKVYFYLKGFDSAEKVDSRKQLILS